MQCGPAGIALAKSYEKLRLEAYRAAEVNRDGSPRWAIGWGTTEDFVTEGMICTEAQADAWFAQKMATVAAAITRMIAKAPVALNQNQFDALCDFGYNGGTGLFAESSMLQLILQGHLNMVPAHLQLYCEMKKKQPDGSVIKVTSSDLVRRRQDEADLWNGIPPRSMTAATVAV